MMKTAILAALMAAASFGASAEGDVHACGIRASLFQGAASMRDSGASPETSLDMARNYKEIPIEDRKRIINLVYFDPRFDRAGGQALMLQMMNLCIYGPKDYKPLK